MTYDPFETVECLHCHKKFKARKQDRKRGLAIYCSRKCWGLAHRGSKNLPPNTTCAWCDKVFRRTPYQLAKSKSGLHFCSRSCKDAAQRIGGLPALHLPHYGDGKSSYRNRALVQRTSCERCGYDKAPTILIVHHKDRDRANGDLSNLEVLCPNCHYEEHIVDGKVRFGS